MTRPPGEAELRPVIVTVDDDPSVSRAVARDLRRRYGEANRIVRAESGEQALDALADEPADAVILDILMPKLDGLEVCRRLRKAGDRTPVLMLTARDAIEDRVRGLESGADDYLVKPFALSELVARSRALVRRNQARGGSVLSLGNLRMDLEARRAYIGEQELALAGREWSILQFMLSRTGKIVAKEQIIAAISNWDGTTSDNAIEVHVSRLRSKLEPAGLKIRTIRGFGYLLEEA